MIGDMNNSKSRIGIKIDEVKKDGRKALACFIAGGDPDYTTSLELLRKLPKNGADIIELGVAFSDPVADGVVIQKAYERALRKGQNLKKTLKMVSEFREDDVVTPIILMGYYNPIFKYGGDRFVDNALKAGVDGLLIVDLPPEENREFYVPSDRMGVDFIRLVTPTSDEKRIKKIVNNASGFIYYVSIAGITGMKLSNLEYIKDRVNLIKKLNNLPVAVGFGIKTREDVQEIAKISDIIVVGSAIITKLAEGLDENGNVSSNTVTNVLEFTKELASGL